MTSVLFPILDKTMYCPNLEDVRYYLNLVMEGWKSCRCVGCNFGWEQGDSLICYKEGSDHFTLKLACCSSAIVISLHPPASQLFWSPSETPSCRIQDVVLPHRCVLCICFHWICHVRNPPSMAYSRYFFYRIK